VTNTGSQSRTKNCILIDKLLDSQESVSQVLSTMKRQNMSHHQMRRKKLSISKDMTMTRWSLWVPQTLSISPFLECPNLAKPKVRLLLNLRRTWKTIKKFILLSMENSSN